MDPKVAWKKAEELEPEPAANSDSEEELKPDPYEHLLEDPFGNEPAKVEGDPSGERLPGSGKMLLEDAKKCKEVGLGAYKVNDYKKAIECWKSAYEQLKLLKSEKIYSESDPEHAEATTLAAVLSLNLAQVHLKQGTFHQALEFSNTVLAEDPNNAKALYRKASAQLMASNFSGARSTVNTWLQLDPDNAEAKQLLSKIAREGKSSKDAEQKAAKKIFGGIEHDPRTENPPPRKQKDEDDLIDEEESGLQKNPDGTYTLDGSKFERPRSAFTDEQWRSFFSTIFFCCRKRKSKSD